MRPPPSRPCDTTLTRRGEAGPRRPVRHAVRLGATLREDRFSDPEEPLRSYADPAGYLFCVFVGAAGPLRTASAMRAAASRSWPGECAA
jgi:hypothetical protein